MAEKVRDGETGLLFRAGHPHSLAEVMTRAASTPGLWEKLAANPGSVPSLAEAVAGHETLYRSLLPLPARATSP